MLSIKLRATGPGLIATLSLDGVIFFQESPAQDTVTVDYGFDRDCPGDHCLEITLSGKLPGHTKIDQQGLILEDRRLIIEDVSLDTVSLGKILHENTVYVHDRNGTTPMTEHRFYGEMGCNGTVKLRFTSPIFLWLLEKM